MARLAGGMSVSRWIFGLALGGLALLLASCATEPGAPARQPPPTVTLPPVDTTPTPPAPIIGETPEHMEGRKPVRVALLLPLSARNDEIRQVAGALLDAAQLAVFEVGNPDLLLTPKDTGGTAAGAQAAAAEALGEGAELILGPLLRDSVLAVAPLARERGVQMISFSTDSDVSGNGVYLLSFQPEQEVERVTSYAVSQQRFNYAALIPISDYGNRVQNSFLSSVQRSGGRVVAVQPYPRRPEDMFDPVKSLAEYQHSLVGDMSLTDDAAPPQPFAQEPAGVPGTVPLGAAESAGAADAYQASQLERLINYRIYGTAPFDAVLLPEGGILLRALAPLLPYFDVDPRKVKFLGTGLWDDPVIGREPALVGGWFAAPPPEARQAFVKRFEAAYGRQPPRISSLSFDAVALAGALARLPQGERFSAETLTNPNGFSGIDGIFRFSPNGTTERGLAVMEVTPTGFKVISPAPVTFEGVQAY